MDIREKLIFARYKAPVAIVVCGNMKLALKGKDEKRVYWQSYNPERKHKTKDKPVIGHY